MSVSKHKRVLHLIDTGGPGGAETIFLKLVAGLPALGWESVPIVPEVDWLESALRNRGISSTEVRSERSLDLPYLRRLRHLVRSERIDLVQTHLLATAVYASVAAIGTGIPVVSTFHGLPDVLGETGIRALKLRAVGRGRNRAVFVSESLRDSLQPLGLAKGCPTVVIPNGIDCDLFTPGSGREARASLGVPEGAPLIGAVGNIRRPKGYGVLLRAFHTVREAVPEAHLVIVGQGSGELLDELLALRTELSLDECTHLAGFRDDVPDIMRALDVFVLSSSDEGFSLSTVQAMATALPVVVTRSGGPEGIVDHGKSGLLVAPQDPHAMAEGIISVLRDPGLAQALASRAREEASTRFSINAMVSGYADLYRRLL